MATPVHVQKPPIWERVYDPKKLEEKIERTVKDIQDRRISNATSPIFRILKGLILAGLIVTSLVVAFTALSPLVRGISMLASCAFILFGPLWVFTLPTDTLEAKLERLFQKMFVADKGKLTPEHLALLKKHAVEIIEPKSDAYLDKFAIGVESTQAIKELTDISPVTKEVVETELKQIKTPFMCVFVRSQLGHLIKGISESIAKKPSKKEKYLNLLKSEMKKTVAFKDKIYAVDKNDANELLQSMTKRQKMSITADMLSPETFKAMQDLPLIDLKIYVDYTPEKAALLPKTLKRMYWMNSYKQEDLKPLAERCPDLEEIKGLTINTEDRKLFKKLKQA